MSTESALARRTEKRLVTARRNLLAIAADWDELDNVIVWELERIADSVTSLAEMLEDVYPKGRRKAAE